ncbi:MAG: hypothetical protein H6Q41_863 [Deltaproteobacteria bacterium]|nr:hypothetical protein [Deltaproteobacteria bacterium]
MRWARIIGFIIFLIPMPLSASGDEFLFIRSDQTVILFQKSIRSLGVELHDIYPSTKSDLEELTGWEIDFIPTFLLLNHSGFLSMVGTKNVVAFADPQRYRIIIDSSRMNRNPFTLSVTAKHELAHLLLHHKINRTHVPRWLDEGFAQWASDGISEVITGNRTFLADAVLQKTLIPLHKIAHYFPENEPHMFLAYEQSKSLVEFIQKEFGAERLLDTLHHMANGESVDEAVLKTLSLRLDTLEHLWHKDLTSRKIWIYYLSTYLYAILFFLASVLAVIGFIRYRIRRKNWREKEE